jgi:hypothetical protein
MSFEVGTIQHTQYRRAGLHRAATRAPADAQQFLRRQVAVLRRQPGGPRPWHYWELHNPWGAAGTAYNSWGFLELCHSPMLVESAAALIGPDIVLFASEWLPDPSRSLQVPATMLESDTLHFAVDPACGVTVLLYFGTGQDDAITFEFAPSRPSEQSDETTDHASPQRLEPGQILAIDAHLPYRLSGPGAPQAPTVFAVRYFPATSRYLRDPTAGAHRALTERYPLLNHARLPLWLARGQDRAENDFVTGFNVRAGYWTKARW